MHYLVSILVDMNDVVITSGAKAGEINREELVKEIRRYAEEITERFSNVVYDWRTTETAGRWSAEYPENVILGSENPETIQLLLEKAVLDFKTIREEGLERILAIYGTTDIARIDDFKHLYVLESIAGQYSYESTFFDTRYAAASISEKELELIMADIDNHAIVLFDEHR